MAYLFIAVGLVVVVVLVWRLVSPDKVGAGARRRRPMGPDDDADFLRRLGEQIRGDDEGPSRD